MNRRRMMMLQQKKKRLPENYTELEYITATQQQWIDTGVTADEYTGARYKYSVSKTVSAGNYIASSSGFEVFPQLRFYGNYQYHIRMVRDKEYIISYPYELNTPYEFFIDEKGTVFLNGEFLISIGNVPSNLTGNKTIVLFRYYGQNKSLYFLNGNVYYFQIFQNGEIVRDFAPCINPDGIVGLYDMVEDKFYRSATTTDFIAGKEV